LVRVALPLPVAEPYRYRVPASLADRALPGARVVVPVRSTEMIGIVVTTETGAESPGLRDVLAAPDLVAAVPLPLLELAAAIARYYGAPVGMVLRAMLPGPLWGKSVVMLETARQSMYQHGGVAGDLLEWLHSRGGSGSATAAARKLKKPIWDVAGRLQRVGDLTMRIVPPDVRGGVATERIAVLPPEPLTLLEREARFARSPQRARIYQALEHAGGRMSVAALLAQVSSTPAPLRAMVADGLVSIELEAELRDPFAEHPVTLPPKELDSAQKEAIDRLAGQESGETGLLFGVTGSGKTAVYLERMRRVMQDGYGALLLVPEIALTPQTVSRVRGVFGDQVAVLHSGLSDGERADAWRALRSGEKRVAVGARSAVFAPVHKLGIIILDEEHESSYKNGETPRYHARDVAAMRARIEGATLILGSATPSLESWARLAPIGKVLRLPDRVSGRPMPPVELVDLRHEPMAQFGPVPWSERLDQAVAATIARREQVLLLLNRRGWAAFIQCLACGEVVQCPNCSISMTVHRHPDQLRCHYCDHRAMIPDRCAICSGDTVQHRGAGTQQLEQLIAERFPTARIARMDLDTTGSKWSHQRILGEVGLGTVDILLGTQMIAKGIDFPNVTLVGVIDADLALHLPDFRSSERTFQLVAQVAGRTGRGPLGGRVLVQTRQPEHQALQHAARHDAEGFNNLELAARSSPAYPPMISLARLVASGADQAQVARRLQSVADWSERAIAKSGRPLIVLGPAPCPVERIKDRWRMHLLIKGSNADVGAWVRTVSPRLMRRDDVKMSVDRDPQSML
jgi:primosomal protein N' (replication factor Y)